MSKILEYIKEQNYNLINIEQSPIEDILNKLQHINGEKGTSETDILYFFSKNMGSDNKNLIQLGFQIPLIKFDLLVLFYKGDYYYIDEKSDNIMLVKDFLEKANTQIFTKCQLCNGVEEHLICCEKCTLQICNNCLDKKYKERKTYCNKCGKNYTMMV
tara:strand:+ start:632 stop:1105 length:474 start_codon:yes stop_codon:yes gene_type:complete